MGARAAGSIRIRRAFQHKTGAGHEDRPRRMMDHGHSDKRDLVQARREGKSRRPDRQTIARHVFSRLPKSALPPPLAVGRAGVGGR